MRVALLLTIVLASTTVHAGSDITSADLVGTWSCGTSSSLGNGRYTFRADHTFDGINGDAISAGRWKLHASNKLELIYYSDYERKTISRSSKHGWIVTKARLEFVWFDKDFSPGFQYSSGGVWSKRR
jgi:hypothetical protein